MQSICLVESRSTAQPDVTPLIENRNPAGKHADNFLEEKERGTKPAPAANAAESTQQKLDRLWVATANAWDCNVRLEHELKCAKDHTNSLMSQLRQEKARQESLQKLIKTKKNQNDQEEVMN